jgi:hypothetical protein
MISLHDYELPENACLLDLYKEIPEERNNLVHDLSNLLKISQEELRQLARRRQRIDGKIILRAQQQEQDPNKKKAIAHYTGLTFEQALAHACSKASPNKALPAATVSFISLIPAVFMTADFVKRRALGWKLKSGAPNVIQVDSFKSIEKGTFINILAQKSCFCQSEKYVNAFKKRQELRKPHLNKAFTMPSRQKPLYIPPQNIGLNAQRQRELNRSIKKSQQANQLPVQVPNQKAQIPVFYLPSTNLCCIALLIYIVGMVASMFLISVLIQYETGIDHFPGPWRIIPLGWKAGKIFEGWLKYSAISTLPVMAYWFLLNFTTYLMKSIKSKKGHHDAGQKLSKIGAKWASGFVNKLFKIIGFPFVLLGIIAFGITNIRAFSQLCSKGGEAACCVLVPLFLVFFYGILIFSGLGINLIGEITRKRCDWVFNLPRKNKK